MTELFSFAGLRYNYGMERIIAGKSFKKRKPSPFEAVNDVKAGIMTLGGALILAIVIIVTLIFVLNFLFPRGNGMQFIIIASLFVIGWGFYLNCVSERLKLNETELLFTSLIGKTIRIPLHDIISYKLTDFGIRLDGNTYLLEVAHSQKRKPEEIWLSPCWDNKDLAAFCSALNNALDNLEQKTINQE